MCLVTTAASSDSMHRSKRKRLKKGVPFSSYSSSRRSSPNTTNNASRVRVWFFLLAGGLWSLYSIHRASWHTGYASVVQHELEQEARYVATLFEKTAQDAMSAWNRGGEDQSVQKPPDSGTVQSAQERDSGTLQSAQERDVLQREENTRQETTQPPQADPQRDLKESSSDVIRQRFSKLHPRHHHAIIIPYRDREYHLEKFIEYMGKYLLRNFPTESFELWIVEQDDKQLFNRAWLTNVGLTRIRAQSIQYEQEKYYVTQGNGITVPPKPRCIILHDVDLVPVVDGVPYTNCDRPIQLGSELAHFNYSVPYALYTGGVGPSMMMQHWAKINGMSNDYAGWGGEDDDLWHRLRMAGLLKHPVPRSTPAPAPGGEPYKGPQFWPPEIERPPKGFGRYEPISEAETVHTSFKSHNQWNRIAYTLELMQNNSLRWQKDGLSDLRVTLTADATTITHLDSIEGDDLPLNVTQTQPHNLLSRPLSTRQATTTTITRKHYITARQQGSIVSSLSIDPSALASFAAIHHLKAIPKLTALEYVHITQTNGGRIERAGASGGISWGACHYHHAMEVEMRCPDRSMPEWEGKVEMVKGKGTHTPWHSPLQDFRVNPFKDRPTFTVVRNPYDRLIDLFYCPWNGYKGNEPSNPTNLNSFIQNALYPKTDEKEEEENQEKEKEMDTKSKTADVNKDKKPPPEPSLAERLCRPQFQYVFAQNRIESYTRPHVNHVLKFEKLEEEFPKLMALYGLEQIVKLPPMDLISSFVRPPKLLTPSHFDTETLKMIHRFYQRDFERFEYERLPLPPESGQKERNPALSQAFQDMRTERKAQLDTVAKQAAAKIGKA